MDEVRAWLSLLFDAGSFIVNAAMFIISVLKRKASSVTDEAPENED